MHKNAKSFMGLRTRLRLVASAGAVLTAFGCSAEAPDADGSVAQVEQPISGGTLVLTSENTDQTKPFGPVVKIDGDCTATKIAAHRFITAAHCLSARRTAGTMTNALDGTSGLINTTITAILPHPSMILAGGDAGGQVSQGNFDVALFDISQSTSYPILEQPSGQVVSPGIGGLTLVGYGDDLSVPSHSGLKQKATFSLGSSSIETVNVHFLAENSTPGAGSGDSGGPLVRFALNQWSIVGIVSGNPFFTRVGAVAEWLANPVVNDFSNNSTGSLVNAKVFGSGPGAEVHCASDGPGDDVKLNYCDTSNGIFTTTLPPNLPAWRLFTSTITTATGAPTYKILNRGNGQCLSWESDDNAADLACAADTAGVRTRQSQAWTFVDRGVAPTAAPTTGSSAIHAFWVVNQRTGECLGTAGGSAATGADVRMFACNAGATDQLWVYTR